MDAAHTTPRIGERRNGRVPCSVLLQRRERRLKYKTDWMRQWRKNNPKADAAKRRRFYKAHPHYSRDYYRKHSKRLLGKINWETRARYVKRNVTNLTDEYVRRRLSFKNSVPMSAWPDSLVKLKRAELKLKRLWQNQKT